VDRLLTSMNLHVDVCDYDYLPILHFQGKISGSCS